MRPYLIEGLDCSGKKTIATKVVQLLADEIKVRVVIGPLVGGVLGTADRLLTGQTSEKKALWYYRLARRMVYWAGPVADNCIRNWQNEGLVIKISSHYRSWARARIEGDRLLAVGYRASRFLRVRFCAAAFLTTDFDQRIMRHRLDYKTGRTKKIEGARFFSWNQEFFERWDRELESLLTKEVKLVNRFDTTNRSVDEVAGHIARDIRASLSG